MEEVTRLRIVQTAHELFRTRGYRSVTIQDLADRMGMSKKTIYQYFSGKEEIASAVMDGLMGRITQTVDLSEADQSDPMLVLRQTVEQVKQHVDDLGILFLEDIKKFLPDLWNRVEQFRAQKLFFIERLLRRAQAEGLIQDIDPRLATIIFLQTVQTVMQPDSQTRFGYSMNEVFEGLLSIFINGLLKRE